MADYTAVKFDDLFAMTASATITGGTLVTASGNGTVAPSTTGDHSIGVAAHDAASGASVSIWPLSGYQHEVQVQTGTIAAGAPVIAGTTGFANTGALATVAAAGTLLGIATVGATSPAKVRFIGV